MQLFYGHFCLPGCNLDKNYLAFGPCALYSPFLLMGFDCLKATEPLRGDSSLFTTNFPEILGTHLIDLRKMKG